MSEIKVNSIKGVAASSAAITVNNTDGTCTANITNRTNKNLILNGDFQIAQRGVSSTSSGYQTVDRHKFSYSGTDEAPTQAQVDLSSSDTPYTLGFRKAYKITNGNQTSGAGADDYIKYSHSVEGQNANSSGWNFKSASSFVTLSFWCKSSVAQSFQAYFETADTTKQAYIFETGSLTADTWTKITKTIPGNPNSTINNDNGRGITINISMFYGTNKTGSNTLNQWKEYSGSNLHSASATTWYTTNDATFEITGVQIEVGDTATDYAHESYGNALAKCQRYFFMLGDHDAQTHNACFGRGVTLNNSVIFAFNPHYPVTMRDAPTAYTQTSGQSGAFLIYEWNTYYAITGNWNIHASGLNSGQVYAACANAGGTNKPMRVQTDSSLSKLGLDAEI